MIRELSERPHLIRRNRDGTLSLKPLRFIPVSPGHSHSPAYVRRDA